MTLETLAPTLRKMLQAAAGGAEARVVVAVDTAAPSGVVVQAMLRARQSGAEHFVLAVAPR